MERAQGIAGAATSTLLSQAIGMTATPVYLYWRRADCLARGELHYLMPDRALLRTIIVKACQWMRRWQ